eukprot:6262666-Prymnesium_polylepis.1
MAPARSTRMMLSVVMKSLVGRTKSRQLATSVSVATYVTPKQQDLSKTVKRNHLRGFSVHD